MNNTNLILSDESEKMKNRELLEEYFSHSLEIDLLLRLYPDDEDTLYQIVNLLVDTCATNRKLLRVAGDDKLAEVVRSRFMKLNAESAPENQPEAENRGYPDDHDGQPHQLRQENRRVDSAGIRQQNPGV